MFFWPLFGCAIGLPLLMILFGYMLKTRPPKTKNPLIGFRTRRAMRNTDTWLFAQTYAGKLWFKLGCILILPSALAFIPAYRMEQQQMATVALIAFLVQAVAFFSAWPLTQRALEENFTESGIRKKK